MTPNTADKLRAKRTALQLIQSSSCADWLKPLEWGQWCRDVAKAGLDGDLNHLTELQREASGQKRAAPITGEVCNWQLLTVGDSQSSRPGTCTNCQQTEEAYEHFVLGAKP